MALDIIARAVAKSAQTNASSAAGTATAAQTSASLAASAAATAQTAAASAQTAANAADASASTALSTANTASANAALALAAASPADLFTNIGTKSIDASVSLIVTSGYSTLGKGNGTYISDALATASLAAAHPRFCKQTANGRYFRLIPSSPDKAISVAQGGAVGGTGVNEQPIIQATIDYACATGCRWVDFPETTYELWCPIRTTAPNAPARDGHPIVITTTDGLGLRGCRVGSNLLLKNSVGGSKNTVTQTVGGQPWQGGGIFVMPNGVWPPAGATVDWIAVENLVIDGGVTFNAADRSNLVLNDKGLRVQDIVCNRVHIRNCTFKNFAGEIYYVGGSNISSQLLENVTLDGSPQSALNPSSSGKFVGINVQAGNSYQACEVFGALRDIHLNVEAWCDQKSAFSAVQISGPATLTTQVNGGPVGAYIIPPCNIRVNVTTKRTQLAQANSRYISSAVHCMPGLYDKNTVAFTVSGEAHQVFSVVANPPAGFALPRIDVSNFKSTAQPYGGTYDYPSADKSYDVAWAAIVLYPSAGTWNLTLNSTYGYADGQKVLFYHGDAAAGKVVNFPAAGAGLKLQKDRKLYAVGDFLELRYDAIVSKWVEERYVTATRQTFLGAAIYDAPDLAPGATTTTTVTATGAALGDQVTSVTLDVSVGGLIVTGYVSAANTVTVVFFNPTATAVNLASANLSVTVQKK